MNKRVFFYNADTNYKIPNKGIVRNKLSYLVHNEGFKLVNVNIILCSDEYLLEINKKHLNHNYYTDVITFDLSDKNNEVDGEIYISLDRIRENKKSL
jgi:probable rRNA maturation factor